MKKNIIIAAMFFFTSMLMTSCATEPRALPVVIPPTEAVARKAAPEESWQKEWNSLLEAARKERVISVLSTSNGKLRDALVKSVKEKLGIEVDYLSVRGAQLSAKLQAERRARIYTADVYLGGSTTITTVLKPAGIVESPKPVIFLPEALDAKAWWGGGLRWLDKDRTNLGLLAYIAPPFLINTTLTKPDELNKSYRDILNPKWKGKILIDEPTQPGSGEKVIFTVGEYYMGWDFIRELVKLEPVLLADRRQAVEWIVHGKGLILIGGLSSVVSEFQQLGMPLRYITPKEGTYISSGSGTLSLINRAPHPNATKVFTNWILTREGQTVISQALGRPSGRLDVSTAGLDADSLLLPGVKYIESDIEEYAMKIMERQPTIKEIFAPLLK